MTASVLIVDDVWTFHRAISPLILAAGFSAAHAKDGQEAITTVTIDDSIVAVITDVQMPRKNGIELLQHLWRSKAELPTYIHSSEATLDWQGQHINLPEYIPMHFGTFASFQRKDGAMEENLKQFLASLPR